MRRLAIISALLLCSVAATQAEDTPPFCGVISGCGVTNHDFTQFKGGVQTGLAIPLDADKGLILRTLYTKAEFGDGNIEAIRISPLLKWYAGKKWDFYLVFGGDAALTDETDGAYFVGAGVNRRIYTGDVTSWAVPFVVDAFVDFTTADTDGGGSNVNQINLGLQFSKPIRR